MTIPSRLISCQLVVAAFVFGACDNSQTTATQEELDQVLEQWQQSAPTAGPTSGDEVLRSPNGLLVPLPPVASTPEMFSDRFMVILMSSREPRAMPPSLVTLASHPNLNADVARVSSSWFQGLMPCFEITIAGAFEYRRQATALARELDNIGVDNYVKQAGRFVGTQEVVEAWCRGDRAPRNQGCGDTRFVEVHDGRPWLWLAADQVTLERSLDGSEPLQPLGGLEAWSVSVQAENIESHHDGESWKLYDPTVGKPLGRCRTDGFSAIVRGKPHFGYLAQQPVPTEPGCGEPELFAALSCKDALPERPLLALPSDHPEPVLYTPLAALRDIDLEDDAKALANRSPAFSAAFRRAHGLAAERATPLQQLVTLQGFVAPERKLLLVLLRLQTGDGVTWCGQDDVRVDLSAIYEWTQEGGFGEAIVPFREHETTEHLGLIDIDADGVPEIVQRTWPDEVELWKSDAHDACAIAKDYCDCPC